MTMTTTSENKSRTVEELINKRIDGDTQSIVWHSENRETKYGLVTVYDDEKDQIRLHTIVLDLNEQSLKVTENSMWIPGSAGTRMVESVARTVSRRTNPDMSEPMKKSNLDFSCEEILSHEIEDTYEREQGNERQQTMHKLRDKFKDAGIKPVDRFIRLEYGGKAPWDGEAQRTMRPPEEIRGNYGVEGCNK